MSQLLQDAEVTTGYVVLKFNDTVKLTSIIPDAFVVATDEATPTEVVSPFEEFTITNNYNTVSRTLKLYWKEGSLTPNTEYTLTITGLLNAASKPLSEYVLHFATEESVEPTEDELEPVVDDSIEIEDHSIITDIDFSADSQLGVEFLEVVSTNLESLYMVDNDFNNGRIAITFSKRPDISKVNSSFIKVYRKKVQRKPSKWERLTVNLSLDSQNPIVYVDFPSTDDDPLYYEADKDYFEDSYKYKISVSDRFSSNA